MFIRKGFQVGDWVRLKRPASVLTGTYTKGHEFKIISDGVRGFDLEDADGNRLCETGLMDYDRDFEVISK